MSNTEGDEGAPQSGRRDVRVEPQPAILHLMPGTATVSMRYSFTVQYIQGTTAFAHRARAIEKQLGPHSPRDIAEHRSLVVTAIMQAEAAMETELFEVLHHGPGHFLGSNGTDAEARDFLGPIIEHLEEASGVVERWRLLLHILKKKPLRMSARPSQHAGILVSLRNELTHYRSRWDGKTSKKALVGSLRPFQHRPPPWVAENSNEFPHKILSADCASWAAEVAADFLDEVCECLGTPSVLDSHRRTDAENEDLIPARWQTPSTPD